MESGSPSPCHSTTGADPSAPTTSSDHVRSVFHTQPSGVSRPWIPYAIREPSGDHASGSRPSPRTTIRSVPVATSRTWIPCPASPADPQPPSHDARYARRVPSGAQAAPPTVVHRLRQLTTTSPTPFAPYSRSPSPMPNTATGPLCTVTGGGPVADAELPGVGPVVP